MNIIPIDDFKRGGRRLNLNGPTIAFNKNGNMFLNMCAVELVKYQPGQFMHFYNDDGDIYIKFDFDPINGLPMSYVPKSSSCRTYAKYVAAYILEIMQLSAKDGILKFKLEAADFGKYQIIYKDKDLS
jgi:hypothetical protein